MTDKLKNELQEYYVELCNRLNACIPCKTQKDVDTMSALLQEMVDSPPKTPKPQLYWNREVWIDCGFDSEKCTLLLTKTDKLYFEPSDDIEEHPGVVAKYKWMKEKN